MPAARAEELELDILWRACDLERLELPRAHYDLIVQVRYVNLRVDGPLSPMR